jgi:hypothetical protein
MPTQTARPWARAATFPTRRGGRWGYQLLHLFTPSPPPPLSSHGKHTEMTHFRSKRRNTMIAPRIQTTTVKKCHFFLLTILQQCHFLLLNSMYNRTIYFDQILQRNHFFFCNVFQLPVHNLPHPDGLVPSEGLRQYLYWTCKGL